MWTWGRAGSSRTPSLESQQLHPEPGPAMRSGVQYGVILAIPASILRGQSPLPGLRVVGPAAWGGFMELTCG